MNYLNIKKNIYVKEILKLCKNVSNNPNYCKDVYDFAKKIAPEFYINGKMSSQYDEISSTLEDNCENKIPHGFIIESTPVYDAKAAILTSFPTPEELLDYIVYQTRNFLVSDHLINKPNIMTFDFSNQCFTAGIITQETCYKLGIETHYIEIYPGYSKEANLMADNGFHIFNIVKIAGKYYLIDSTYRQFFTLAGNYLSRVGIPYTSGCNPGIYMILDEERMRIASTLLKRGWISIDDTMLKAYFDGFSLSYRNGLYYEQTADFSFTTPYNADQYIRFLMGEDNQINYEGTEVLGYQLRPNKRVLKLN